MSRLLADEFGFKELYITVIAGNERNAITPPISYAIECMPLFRLKKNLYVDKNSMKFKPESGYVLTMSIYSGLLLSDDFSDAEIMAVLLHEIGHNF